MRPKYRTEKKFHKEEKRGKETAGEMSKIKFNTSGCYKNGYMVLIKK